MLKSKARWKLIDKDNYAMNNFSQSITELLLHQSGIVNQEAKHRFLNPKLEHIQHPKNLKDIDIACKRIYQAIEAGEQIIVYGDYDADGITSTSVLIKTLTKLGAFCDYYIPHRLDEG